MDIHGKIQGASGFISSKSIIYNICVYIIYIYTVYIHIYIYLSVDVFIPFNITPVSIFVRGGGGFLIPYEDKLMLLPPSPYLPEGLVDD
jgi:hypothetical protein